MKTRLHNDDIQTLRMIASRLERLSADSRMAHRASGLRGNILKMLSEIEDNEVVPIARIAFFIDRDYKILEIAARGIPEDTKGNR